MTLPTVSFALDESRAGPFSRSFNSFYSSFVDLHNVVTIDYHAGHVVAACPVSYIFDRSDVFTGGEFAVKIVLTHVDHWKFPRRRYVE